LTFDKTQTFKRSNPDENKCKPKKMGKLYDKKAYHKLAMVKNREFKGAAPRFFFMYANLF
jgi:hypothetical protein